MKKVFLTLVLMLTTMLASAQFYVGGGIGYCKTEISNVEASEFTFTPEMGYVINDNWSIGAVLDIDWVKDTSTTIAVSPYARYTFLRAGNFSFFADGVLQLGSIDPKDGESQTYWGIGVKPGIDYSLTKNFSITAHIGWLGHHDYKDYGETTAITINGNDLSFSLSYNF